MQVGDIKEELAGLGEHMEEMRGVCRQLQSQLKTFPDCSETSFEAESDSLMDSWLDVSDPAADISAPPASRPALVVTPVDIMWNFDDLAGDRED